MKKLAWSIVLFLIPLLAVLGLVRVATGKVVGTDKQFLPDYTEFMGRLYAMPDFGAEVLNSYAQWLEAVDYVNKYPEETQDCGVWPYIPTSPEDKPMCDNYWQGTIFDGKSWDVVPKFFNMVGNAIAMPIRVIGYTFETLFAL